MPGVQGVAGFDWDGKRQANELIEMTQTILRHNDAIRESHDVSAQLLLDSIRQLEKQLKMDDQEIALSDAEMKELQRASRAMNAHLTAYKEKLNFTTEALYAKQKAQGDVKSELARTQSAEKGYQARYPSLQPAVQQSKINRPSYKGGAHSTRGGGSRLAAVVALGASTALLLGMPAL